jgi:GNAT superfamily N-acetyltransferase
VIQTVECSAAREIRVVSTESDSAQFEQDRADAHLVVIDDNEGPKAQCSLWWSQVPQLPGWRLGTIGHYCAGDDFAAHILLACARNRLRAVGCNRAIGPMDGSSWRRYRFVTEVGTERAFFLEPQNPPGWPKQFTAAGFFPLAHYISSLNPDLSQHDPRLAKAEARLRSLGVVLRSLRTGEVEPYLPRIHQVCRVAFRTNYLYADLSQSDFLRQYEQLVPLLCSELIIVAEQESETVGFLFAVPDLLRRKHGLPLDTFIIKTVAILPRYELGGLGTLLVGRAQQIGAHMGFQRSIHALMHAGNTSALNISDAYATPMRGYALYAQELCA